MSSAAAARSAARLASANASATKPALDDGVVPCHTLLGDVCAKPPRRLSESVRGGGLLESALAGDVELNLNGTYQSGGYRSPQQEDAGLAEALV